MRGARCTRAPGADADGAGGGFLALEGEGVFLLEVLEADERGVHWQYRVSVSWAQLSASSGKPNCQVHPETTSPRYTQFKSQAAAFPFLASFYCLFQAAIRV